LTDAGFGDLPDSTPPSGMETDEVVRDPTPVLPLPVPHRRRGWRLARRIGAAVVGVLAVYYLATLWIVFRTGNTDQARPVDAIVVLGAAHRRSWRPAWTMWSASGSRAWHRWW
jgi:hypothetical protein